MGPVTRACDQQPRSPYRDMFTPPCILAAILTDALAKYSSLLFLRLWTLLLYIVMPWLTKHEDMPEPRVVFILGLVLRTRDVSPSEMQAQVWGACIGLGRDPIDVTSALLYGPPLLVGGVETPNGSPTGHRDLSGLLRNLRRAQRSKLLASLADKFLRRCPTRCYVLPTECPGSL